jgi:prepilin-type N-terminal cleavage/methylation domain-containing protein
MRQRAFTIIELLITIFIIALLLTAAAAGVSRARKVGRDAQRGRDIGQIAAAVDQYTTTTRGAYPKHRTTPTTATFCATELGGLELGGFINRTIPSDPLPEISSTPCTGYRNGYTYHSRFGGVSGNLTRNGGQQYEYALEAGFELERSIDDINMQEGSATNGSSRIPYVLYGKPCALVPSRTCTEP